MNYVIERDGEHLSHFGIKGQKWGIRRYQNEDGTLTEEGMARYRKDAEAARKEITNAYKDKKNGMSIDEANSMQNDLLFGRKYRKLGKAINKGTRKEAYDYAEIRDRKAEEAKEYAKSDDDRGFFESLFYSKSGQKDLVRRLNDEHKAAGKEYADAIASVSTQFIKENFPERKQAKAEAWVYAMYIQGNDREIKTAFDEG